MKNLFVNILNRLFGCSHSMRHHSSLPFTDESGQSYKKCLRCGTSLAYSIEDFQYITPGFLRRKRREAKRREKELAHVRSSSAQPVVV